MSYGCLVTVNTMLLVLTVPWVRLQCVLVLFPDHTHLLSNVFVFFKFTLQMLNTVYDKDSFV